MLYNGLYRKFSYLPIVLAVITIVGMEKSGLPLLSATKDAIFWMDSIMSWNDASDMMTDKMTIATGSRRRLPAHFILDILNNTPLFLLFTINSQFTCLTGAKI